jgi:NAD(P)-dependent dehydrogenase (short-subunit alcohol dehydrogenase family)
MSILTKLFSLEGRTAVVTGGAKGIGAMIATALVGAGCEVFIVARSVDAGEKLAAELSKSGRCHFLRCDLGDSTQIETLGAALRDRLDSLDILINNAGIFSASDIPGSTAKQWDDTLAVNVRAPFLLVQALLPLLEAAGAKRGPARIINISSIGGVGPQSNSAHAYGASKAALHQLTRMLASDLTTRKINVNTIVPGYFPTDMTDGFFKAIPGLYDTVIEKIPAHRLGSAEDIGGAVIFLCSRAGAYLSGGMTTLDGGLLSV